MDSTLIQSNLHPSSASKLPIKRKNPESDQPFSDSPGGRAPPFKFHRIWTEPDEIRFLRGLLDCSPQNLVFPRDLGIFYARFSNIMSQPYTKSQLSEKLRRLRKKFRVVSSRLSKGMDRSQLSIHDRALYDLSKQLWHPDYSATSPFNGARKVDWNQVNNLNSDMNVKQSSLVGVKVDFSPTLPAGISGFDHENNGNGVNEDLDSFDDLWDGDNHNEVNLSEVDIEFEGEEETATQDEGNDGFVRGIRHRKDIDFVSESRIIESTSEVVTNVFDEWLKDMKMRVLAGRSRAERFQIRWQQQRMAELDVFGSRLRLVLEKSLRKR